MTWTAPMTAVANNVFTAAQFNAHVRDNLLETAAAKATTAGRLFVATGANAVGERGFSASYVVTAENTASGTGGSFVDLSTVGPEVTVTTGTQAMVWYGAAARTSVTGYAVEASVAVSGATTVAASPDWGIAWDGLVGGDYMSASRPHLFTGLTPGSNTFTMKYKKSTAVSGQTGSWQTRHMVVLPL